MQLIRHHADLLVMSFVAEQEAITQVRLGTKVMARRTEKYRVKEHPKAPHSTQRPPALHRTEIKRMQR